MHQNLPYWEPKSKKISGEGQSPLPRWGGGHPLPHPSARRLRRLDPRACGARRSRSFSVTTRTLVKCQQSGSMTVTADVPIPTGKEQCSSPVVQARRHCPWTTHLPASTVPSRVATAASRRCLHAAGCSANAMRPRWTSPPAAQRRSFHPSIDLYAGVKFWTFLTSKECVDLYADRLIRENIWYMNFHRK